jgi:tetratricopeptide (TPR) repeat protein
MNKKTFNVLAALALGAGFVFATESSPLDKHYPAAQAALAKGDTSKAKRELKLTLQENPLHAEAHFLLASLLGREGDLEQAVVGFQQTLALEPNNSVARFNLGTGLLWRGEPVAAARQLEEAISIRPDYAPSYNNLAKAYFLAGLPELAVASYKEALRRDPSNVIARKNLGLLTATTGNQPAPEPGDATKPPPASGLSAKPVTPGPHDTVDHKPADDGADAAALRDLLRDLPHVTVDRRGERLTLDGWTRGTSEVRLLERILAGRTDVINLTTDDAGDPHRLLEVDAILFLVIGIDAQSAGHNFLRRVQVNASVADAAMAEFSWLYSAAISYQVNIANASEQRIAFLARPHLSTLSGTPATFIAGGDIVFKVSGTTSGDIKPYPFGTKLEVTPTLLRTPGEDGLPRVHLTVKAGRKSILPLESIEVLASGDATAFSNVEVTSEAVLRLNQTLILTGLSQRENQTLRSGVPGLRNIPIIKYLFSEKTTTVADTAIIILLTPRDPAYWDQENKKAVEEFTEKRRAYLEARQGTEDDMRRFKERYPDWDKLAPNRFASHFFLTENSEVYRAVSGVDLAQENLELDLLGKQTKKK